VLLLLIYNSGVYKLCYATTSRININVQAGFLPSFSKKKKNSALLADLILNKLQIVGKNIVEAIEQVRWIGLIFLF